MGVKLSQEGSDVQSASDEELIWSSDFNLFKIVESGTVEVPLASDGTTSSVVVSHSQGVVPIVLAFFDNGSAIFSLPSVLVESSGANAGKILQLLTWQATTTEITFFNQSQLQGTAGGPVKYYILKETAS